MPNQFRGKTYAKRKQQGPPITLNRHSSTRLHMLVSNRRAAITPHSKQPLRHQLITMIVISYTALTPILLTQLFIFGAQELTARKASGGTNAEEYRLGTHTQTMQDTQVSRDNHDRDDSNGNGCDRDHHNGDRNNHLVSSCRRLYGNTGNRPFFSSSGRIFALTEGVRPLFGLVTLAGKKPDPRSS